MAQKSYINNLLKQIEKKSTGKMTQKEFENFAPNQFVLYGYNSHVKRWDVISDFQGKRLNTNALYGFDVREDNQKIFYRIFHTI